MKILLVKAKFETPPDHAWSHRFHNFGDDVWRALKEETDVSLEEIDRSVTSFEVRGLKARRVGRAKKTIQALIESHGFEGDLAVEEIG